MIELFSHLASPEWCNLPLFYCRINSFFSNVSMQPSNDNDLIRRGILDRLYGSRVQLVIEFTINKLINKLVLRCLGNFY
ncbi:hypothetical protein EUGRSUZ_E02795 [Eucalyptus grandis]|uniref:Uncharacterized protein n=2 Tax=Eucalyptus grandis TaxID=71139 RepID=A0ACC3KYB3_EUCGR|nr:hypothetical protein EUGRSUZ_E02795 [Eucalyptus grandis]